MKYYKKIDDQIILDMNEDLVKELNEEQRGFWSNLNQEQKNLFVHMSNADRQKLMSGDYDKKNSDLIWKYCSRLVLRYANEGHGLLGRASDLYKVGIFCLGLVAVSVAGDIVLQTYWKNSNLHNLIGTAQAIQISENSLKINSNQNELIKTDNLMSAEQLVSYIQTPGFKCIPLENIEDSFYHADGIPGCTTDSVGFTWVTAYIKHPTAQGIHAEPVLLQKKNGQWYSVVISEMLSPTLPNLETVSLKQIEGDLQIAFNKNNKGEN